MTYQQAKIKRMIEELIMFPFVMMGKIIGFFFPLNTRHDLFLFFPNGDIGGSAQVNIDITRCVRDVAPLIIFSKKPKNNQFIEQFRATGVKIIDLAPYIDRKLFHFVNFFFRGVIASWINKREQPVIFGGECIFFYKMLPHLKKNVRCIELSHLPTWLPYNIGFIDRIDVRIFSTLKLKEQVIKQYNENKLGNIFYERLLFIDNAVDIPPPVSAPENDILEVVFIGRGAPQKRVHLIADIAQKMNGANDKIHFSFVGDVEKMINPVDFPFCRFYGNVKDEMLMDRIYRQSDVLILTSAFEGLPIVVMKMMAYGKIVLSTAVNGIPDYIEHMKNGLLIQETDEDKIVIKGIALLRAVISDPKLKKALGEKSRDIATSKFSKKVFCKIYRQTLLNHMHLP
jgi:glycosyltransferase involved in cell wall biosynthesis